MGISVNEVFLHSIDKSNTILENYLIKYSILNIIHVCGSAMASWLNSADDSGLNALGASPEWELGVLCSGQDTLLSQ